MDEVIHLYFLGRHAAGLDKSVVARSFSEFWQQLSKFIGANPLLMTPFLKNFLIESYILFAKDNFSFLASKSFELFRPIFREPPFVVYVGLATRSKKFLEFSNTLACALGHRHQVHKGPYFFAGGFD